MSAVGRAVRTGRRIVRRRGWISEGSGFRRRTRLQRRQRDVVQHGHVRRDACGVFHSARTRGESACQQGSRRTGAGDRAAGHGVRDRERRAVCRVAR